MGSAETILTKKDREFIQAVMDGESKCHAWKRLHIGQTHADRILARDDVRQMMADAAWEVIRTNGKKAAQRLSEQLDDESPWIVQNAAREILNQMRTLENSGHTAVVVNFGSMTPPGMPIAVEVAEAEGEVK